MRHFLVYIYFKKKVSWMLEEKVSSPVYHATFQCGLVVETCILNCSKLVCTYWFFIFLMCQLLGEGLQWHAPVKLDSSIAPHYYHFYLFLNICVVRWGQV